MVFTIFYDYQVTEANGKYQLTVIDESQGVNSFPKTAKIYDALSLPDFIQLVYSLTGQQYEVSAKRQIDVYLFELKADKGRNIITQAGNDYDSMIAAELLDFYNGSWNWKTASQDLDFTVENLVIKTGEGNPVADIVPLSSQNIKIVQRSNGNTYHLFGFSSRLFVGKDASGDTLKFTKQ